MDEPDLLARARAGDPAAMNWLIAQHERAVYTLCLRMLRNPDDAADAAQQTWLSAWENLPNQRGESFKSWVLTIASRKSLDFLRAVRRRPTDPLDGDVDDGPVIDPADGAALPEELVLGGELARALACGIDALSPDHRVVVLLRDVHGLAYEEIALAVGAELGTVKSRINRGRLALRTWLLANHAELAPSSARPI
jgi:RNA polymerase sigma-70 factor (ECF subfamily)